MAARGWRPQPASAGFVLLACRFSGRRRGALLPSRLLGAAPAFLLAFRPCALVHDLSPGCFVRFLGSPPRPGTRRVGGGRQRQAVLPRERVSDKRPHAVSLLPVVLFVAPLSPQRVSTGPLPFLHGACCAVPSPCSTGRSVHVAHAHLHHRLVKAAWSRTAAALSTGTFFAALLWRHAPAATALRAIINVVDGATWPLTVLAISGLIDAVARLPATRDSPWHLTLPWLALLLGALLLRRAGITADPYCSCSRCEARSASAISSLCSMA
jgi:hypothetical protein